LRSRVLVAPAVSIASAPGYTAFDLTLRLSRTRRCLVTVSSKPVMTENISAGAFIMVVRTFRPFSVRTNPVARAIVRVGFPAQQAKLRPNGFVGLQSAALALSKVISEGSSRQRAVLCKVTLDP
jgi:hypothetical protein